MTRKDAFLYGFLCKCADDGCSPEEVKHRARLITAGMHKSAFIGGLANAAVDAGKTLWNVAKPVAIAAPLALGAAGGYGLAQMGDDNFDVEDAKADEELAEWYRAIESLRRSQGNPQQV